MRPEIWHGCGVVRKGVMAISFWPHMLCEASGTGIPSRFCAFYGGGKREQNEKGYCTGDFAH